MKSFAALLLVALAVVLPGCGGSETPSTTTEAPAVAPPPTSPANPLDTTTTSQPDANPGAKVD